MTAQIIDGKKVAAEFRSEIADEIKEIKHKFDTIPGLAVILVGCNAASETYVNAKEKAAHQVGMNSVIYKLSVDISENELLEKIAQLNNDKKIHGILVQLPLPEHISSHEVIHAIDPRKDVDGFNVVNVGKLSVGQVGDKHGAIVPCTPLGSMYLLKSAIGHDLQGVKALVIGASNIVGRPLAQLLMLAGCTVTVANSKTRDLKAACLDADVIFSATGKAGLIKADMVKKGVVIIDIGINRIS